MASKPQLDAVAAASEAIRTFVATGEPGTLEVGPDLQKLRDLVGPPASGGTAEVTVAPVGDDADLTGPTGAARVVAAEGGVLALISYDVSYVHSVEKGYVITIQDAAFAQLTNQTGERRSYAIPRVLMVAVEIPDGGTPRVLGAYLRHRELLIQGVGRWVRAAARASAGHLGAAAARRRALWSTGVCGRGARAASGAADRPGDPVGVDPQLAEHAADRVGVAGEVETRRRARRPRTVHPRQTPLVEHVEVADQRLQAAAVPRGRRRPRPA